LDKRKRIKINVPKNHNPTPLSHTAREKKLTVGGHQGTLKTGGSHKRSKGREQQNKKKKLLLSCGSAGSENT